MGKVTGFLEFDRQEQKYQLAGDRIRHFREFTLPLDEKDVGRQAARCMDCGVPYCHSGTGCPVNNQIPDWNDLVYSGDWQEAARNLHSTNNFPEFTGRICPAPCEEACTLNLEDMPVTIKTIEQSIADKAWTRAGCSPSCRQSRPASGSRSSAPVRQASPPHSNSPASAMTCTSLSASPAPAACFATAFPTSRWKSAISTGAWRRWRPRVSCSTTASMSASRSPSPSSLPSSTPCSWPAAPRDPRDPELPGQELDGRAIRHALSRAAEPPRGGRGGPRRSRSWPAASTSSSSEAATPLRTASARPSARARSR